MSNVRERRDMRGRLRAADPLGRTVGEALVLPYLASPLPRVAQRPSGPERDPPGRWVHDRGSHLIHGQLAVTDSDQPYLAHSITVPCRTSALAPLNPL